MNSKSEQDIVASNNSVILKPTGLCNAKCKFCYAVNFSKNAQSVDRLEEQFVSYVEKNNISNIILTGGEVTLVPNFLKELCEYADKNDITVSLVSNLIEIINKEEWKCFLSEHPKLFLTGSYQLDDLRRDNKGEKISIDSFIDFVHWYIQALNKKMLVISVLNYDNEENIIENVKLAKEIGYISSIERQIKVGRAEKEYLPLDYFKILNKIIDLNLWEYEKHLSLFVQCGLFKLFYCNFYCKRMVPVIYLNRENKLVETYCDQLSTTKYDYRDYLKVPLLKKECAFCKLYDLCQGCHLTRKNMKDGIDNGDIDLEKYCKNFKKTILELETKIKTIRGEL